METTPEEFVAAIKQKRIDHPDICRAFFVMANDVEEARHFSNEIAKQGIPSAVRHHPGVGFSVCALALGPKYAGPEVDLVAQWRAAQPELQPIQQS